MPNSENQNPLFDSQREKAGANTVEDYAYQYHWALYRALQEQEHNREYAVFVELHEDVVISNSLNADNCMFEFNQVKTTNIPFNTRQLVVKKNGSSILGKLIRSGLDKRYTNRISNLNLVVLKGFNLEYKQQGVKLDKIRLEDLSQNQLQKLEFEMNVELNITSLPRNLQFIVAQLSEKNFSGDVIAHISRLITSNYPESRYNSVDIYRLLIDELNRKGVVTYDYTNWDELIKKKSLTSTTVTEVINNYTNLKNEEKIEVQFTSICTELNINFIQSRDLRHSFRKYQRDRVSNGSTLQSDTKKCLQNLIEDNYSKNVNDLQVLIDNVKREVPKKIKQQFITNNDITGAIICEIIMNSQ